MGFGAYKPSDLPQPTLLHFPSKPHLFLPPTTLSVHQSIYLTWWTVRRAKLISFRVHGSHGNHLMSAPKPICSKHYPSTADCRIVCFAMVCTCALPIDPASKSIVPHLQKPDLHLCISIPFKTVQFKICSATGLVLIKNTYSHSLVIKQYWVQCYFNSPSLQILPCD